MDNRDGTRPGKRGRRQGVPDPAEGPLAEFAHALVALKVAAGDPSYERMRGQLGAMASKSALSAAARGRELPSWETTWEFVRSLSAPGSDLAELRREWRLRWEAARPEPAVEAPPRDVTAREPATAEITAPATGATARPGRRNRLLSAAVVAAGIAGGLVWLLAASSAAPPIDGDRSTFVADVTVPDGAVVPAGRRFVKTWELRNSGRVAWSGRYLQRIGGPGSDGCRSADRVAVPPTEPGGLVRVSVTVDAPPGPGACTVLWKMVDEQGRQFFPTAKSVYFTVTVAG